MYQTLHSLLILYDIDQMEGTVSQIFYIGLSFYFMKSTKLGFIK